MKNKLVEYWSKYENRVLLFSILIYLVLTIYAILTMNLTDFEPNIIGKYDPDSVVAGYIALFDAASSLASILGAALFIILVVFFFKGAGILCLVLNIISRLFRLGDYKKWKAIVSKIFFFLSLVPCLAVLIAMIFFGFIYAHLNMLLFIITVIVFILIIIINIFSIKYELKIK